VGLETDIVRKKGISGRRVIIEVVDVQIQNKYHQAWNLDHFGPLKVPKDSFFVMGDNRHMAPDSRYTGFISSRNVVGTVFHGQKIFGQ
jgi:signal peptidase I